MIELARLPSLYERGSPPIRLVEAFIAPALFVATEITLAGQQQASSSVQQSKNALLPLSARFLDFMLTRSRTNLTAQSDGPLSDFDAIIAASAEETLACHRERPDLEDPFLTDTDQVLLAVIADLDEIAQDPTNLPDSYETKIFFGTALEKCYEYLDEAERKKTAARASDSDAPVTDIRQARSWRRS